LGKAVGDNEGEHECFRLYAGARHSTDKNIKEIPATSQTMISEASVPFFVQHHYITAL